MPGHFITMSINLAQVRLPNPKSERSLYAISSMLPINNPVARTAFPKLITSRFQTEIRPQFVDGERLTCERISFAPLKMLVNSGAFIRMSVPSHDRVVHRFECDLVSLR